MSGGQPAWMTANPRSAKARTASAQDASNEYAYS
jgi:hypothetical protein